MSGLRGRSAVAADHRSAVPRVPGIPWWAAVIVAIAGTAIGATLDSGSEDALGGVFAAFYALGCVAAVLAVRQSAVFTAVIQPPLILFVAVPSAYFVGHGSTYTGMKDTLINCGYPLIERFPLMFFTTAAVLLIGMVRWYLGAAARRAAPAEVDAEVESPAEAAETAAPAKATAPRRGTRTTTARASRAAAVEAVDDEATSTSRRSTRTRTDPPRASSAQRSPGTTGAGSRRSRHSLPPETETVEPVPERARRRSTPAIDSPAEPRRRPRSGEPRDREPRDREREPRDRRPLPPLERRSPADRADRAGRAERPERYDRPQRRDRSDAQDRAERPQRRPRVSDYETFDTFDPPPATRTNGGGKGGTHHPVSRVRYRGTDDGESRVEQRTRPRPSRHAAPDSWE